MSKPEGCNLITCCENCIFDVAPGNKDYRDLYRMRTRKR